MSEHSNYVIALPERPPAAAALFRKVSDPVVYRQLGEASARLMAKREREAAEAASRGYRTLSPDDALSTPQRGPVDVEAEVSRRTPSASRGRA
jgi:hypothetical protein